MSFNPIHITLLGPLTSALDFVEETLTEVFTQAGISYKIKHNSTISDLIQIGVKSVPAIQVNNGTIFYLKHNGDLALSLRIAINQILITYNLGRLPRILVPLDLTETSENVIYYAHRLSKQLELAVLFQHVVSPSSLTKSQTDNFKEIVAKRSEICNELLNKIAEDSHGEFFEVPYYHFQNDIGFVSDKILEAAEHSSVELVLLQSNVKKLVQKKWFGSVSLDVVKHSLKPILLLPERHDFKRISKIIYFFDKYANDKVAIPLLIQLFNSEVEIRFVHYYEEYSEIKGDYIKELMKDFKISYTIDFVKVKDYRTLSAHWNHEYEEYDADLIVVAKSKHSFISRLLSMDQSLEAAINPEFPILLL